MLYNSRKDRTVSECFSGTDSPGSTWVKGRRYTGRSLFLPLQGGSVMVWGSREPRVQLAAVALSSVHTCAYNGSRMHDASFPGEWFEFPSVLCHCSLDGGKAVRPMKIPALLIHTPQTTTPTPQLFCGPFSGTTQASRCQKRTSVLYGARED